MLGRRRPITRSLPSGGQDARPVPLPQPSYRIEIEMVIVIMGQQQTVDGRQIVEGDAGAG